ncbi:serine/arginine repetitive matrix protein 2-like [Erinaceus europaeus]|uniref:Serine/arginine repetitive matrix protein 2-like n=1 Tax=Erinaceus europaeus TaxID=9365 RepID=A0ABM3WUW7_ERIEU|nr:serine/arginine repetitive matrix protein 2-like [Erinaceus europaeus]
MRLRDVHLSETEEQGTLLAPRVIHVLEKTGPGRSDLKDTESLAGTRQLLEGPASADVPHTGGICSRDQSEASSAMSQDAGVGHQGGLDPTPSSMQEQRPTQGSTATTEARTEDQNLKRRGHSTNSSIKSGEEVHPSQREPKPIDAPGRHGAQRAPMDSGLRRRRKARSPASAHGQRAQTPQEGTEPSERPWTAGSDAAGRHGAQRAPMDSGLRRRRRARSPESAHGQRAQTPQEGTEPSERPWTAGSDAAGRHGAQRAPMDSGLRRRRRARSPADAHGQRAQTPQEGTEPSERPWTAGSDAPGRHGAQRAPMDSGLRCRRKAQSPASAQGQRAQTPQEGTEPSERPWTAGSDAAGRHGAQRAPMDSELRRRRKAWSPESAHGQRAQMLQEGTEPRERPWTASSDTAGRHGAQRAPMDSELRRRRKARSPESAHGQRAQTPQEGTEPRERPWTAGSDAAGGHGAQWMPTDSRLRRHRRARSPKSAHGQRAQTPQEGTEPRERPWTAGSDAAGGHGAQRMPTDSGLRRHRKARSPADAHGQRAQTPQEGTEPSERPWTAGSESTGGHGAQRAPMDSGLRRHRKARSPASAHGQRAQTPQEGTEPSERPWTAGSDAAGRHGAQQAPMDSGLRRRRRARSPESAHGQRAQTPQEGTEPRERPWTAGSDAAGGHGAQWAPRDSGLRRRRRARSPAGAQGQRAQTPQEGTEPSGRPWTVGSDATGGHGAQWAPRDSGLRRRRRARSPADAHGQRAQTPQEGTEPSGCPGTAGSDAAGGHGAQRMPRDSGLRRRRRARSPADAQGQRAQTPQEGTEPSGCPVTAGSDAAGGHGAQRMPRDSGLRRRRRARSPADAQGQRAQTPQEGTEPSGCPGTAGSDAAGGHGAQRMPRDSGLRRRRRARSPADAQGQRAQMSEASQR